MAAPSPSRHLLGLPRELRDHIISYLTLPESVYTSSDTTGPLSPQEQPKTFIDSRIYLPSCVSPNALAACRQLREECLQYHNRTLAFRATAPLKSQHLEIRTLDILLSNHQDISDDRKKDEAEAEAERLGDRGLRISLLVQRPQRNRFGYAVPTREELSLCFINLLPLMDGAKNLRLVIWPGLDWWNGSRPRSFVKVNGRVKIDVEAPPQPDAVSVAVGKVLEQLPAVEELEIDVVAHATDFSKWDLPDLPWTNIQYWLDGPVVRGAGKNLKKVSRRLAGVWGVKLVEGFYEQQETRLGEGSTWHVKRHGDQHTPMMKSLADPEELKDMQFAIDEEYDRID